MGAVVAPSFSPKDQYNQMLQSAAGAHFFHRGQPENATPGVSFAMTHLSAAATTPSGHHYSVSQPASVRATPTSNVFDLYGPLPSNPNPLSTSHQQPLSVQPLMVINTPLPSHSAASAIYGTTVHTNPNPSGSGHNPLRTDSFIQATRPDSRHEVHQHVLNNHVSNHNRTSLIQSRSIVTPSPAASACAAGAPSGGFIPMLPLSRLSRSTPASPLPISHNPHHSDVVSSVPNTTVYYNQIQKNQEIVVHSPLDGVRPASAFHHPSVPASRRYIPNRNVVVSQSPVVTSSTKTQHQRASSAAYPHHARSGSCSSILSHGLRDLESEAPRPKSHSPASMQPYYNLPTSKSDLPLTAAPPMGAILTSHPQSSSLYSPKVAQETLSHGRQSSSSPGFYS